MFPKLTLVSVTAEVSALIMVPLAYPSLLFYYGLTWKLVFEDDVPLASILDVPLVLIVPFA